MTCAFHDELCNFLEEVNEIPTPSCGWALDARLRGLGCQTADVAFRHWSACKIQAAYRSMRCRREFEKKKSATIFIQRWWKGPMKSRLECRKKRDKSAKKIQRCWRSWRDKRVFEQLKEMAYYLEKNVKSHLIRREEAELLSDSAVGAKLRLRFCGTVYPPILVYKMFSRCLNADVGAVPSGVIGQGKAGSKKTWYIEQKLPWIPVDARIYRTFLGQVGHLFGSRDVQNDLMLRQTPLHPSPVKRLLSHKESRQARSRARCQRMRQWRSEVEQQSRSNDVCKVPGGETVDSDASGEQQDPLDAIMRWSRGLNYESYLRDWYRLTTS